MQIRLYQMLILILASIMELWLTEIGHLRIEYINVKPMRCFCVQY